MVSASTLDLSQLQVMVVSASDAALGVRKELLPTTCNLGINPRVELHAWKGLFDFSLIHHDTPV